MRRATSFLLLWHCCCSFSFLPLAAGCRLPPAGATSLRCCWGSPCRACSLQGAATGRLVPNTPAVVRLQQSINTGAVGAAEAEHRQFCCLAYARTRERRRATPSGPPRLCGRWLRCSLAGGDADGSAAAGATRWGHFSGSRRPSPALATGGYCSRTLYAHGCGCCWYPGFCVAGGSSSEVSRCNKREMVFSLHVVLQEQHPLSRSCRSAVSCYGATKRGRHITWSREKQRVDIRIVCAFAAVQKRVKDKAWLFLSFAKVDPRGSKGIVQQRVKPGHKLLVVAGAVAPRLPWKRQASGLCHVKLLSPSVLLPSCVARAAPGDQPPLAAARVTSAAATNSDAAGRKASAAAVGESTKAEGRTAPEALNGRSPSRFFWPPLRVSATAGPTATETAAGEGRTVRNDISPGLPHLRPHFLALRRPALPQTRLVARAAPEKETLLVAVSQYLRNGAMPAEGHRTFHGTRVTAAACVALVEVPDSATSLSPATSLACSAAGKATQPTAAEASTHGGSPVAEAATEAKRREDGERIAAGAAAARTPATQIAGHTTEASLRGLISLCRLPSVVRCDAYEAAARPGWTGEHLLVESSLSGFARQWLERCCSSPACVAVSSFPSFLRPLFPVPVSYRLSCPPLRITPHRALSVRRQQNAAATRAWQRENSRFLEGRRTEKHITATRSSYPGRRYRLCGVTRGVNLSPTSVQSRFLVCFPFFYSAFAETPVVPFSTAQRIGSRTSSRPGDRSQTATLPVGASGGRCNSRHTVGGDNYQDSAKDTCDRASNGSNSSLGSKEVFGVRRVGRLRERCGGRSRASTRESQASAATVGCSSVPMTESRASALQQGCTEHEDELAEENTGCNNTGQKATAAVVDAAASLPLVVAEATERVAKARAVRGTDTVENRELSALVMKACAVAQERRVLSRAAAEGATGGRTARTKDAAPARDALAVGVATADVSQSTAARAVTHSIVTPKATTGIEKTAAASAPQVAKAAIPAAKPITAETATPSTARMVIDAEPAGTTLRSATKSVTVIAGKERSPVLRAAARTSETDASHSYAGKNMQGEKDLCSGYMRSAARRAPPRASSPAAVTDSCAATEDIASASAAGDRGIAPSTTAITTPTAAAVAASGGELRTAGAAAEDRSKRKKLLWALTDSTTLSARRQRGSATAAAASFRHADAAETCARPLAAASIAAAEDLPDVAGTSFQSPVARYAAAAECGVLPAGTPRAAKSQACDVTPSKTRKRAVAGAAVVTTIKGRYGTAASVPECCETAAGLAAGAPFQTGTVAPQVIAAAQHNNEARQHPRASLQEIAAGAEGRREKKKSSCSSRSVLQKTTRHSSSGKKSVKRTRKCANAAASGSPSNRGRRVLAIIDGSCLAFRSHYGMPEVLDGSGIPVQAILGFFRSLSGIKKALLQPSHLVVVFDSSSSRSSRLAIYDGYKGHRNETPTTLQQQFLVIMRLCHALGVCTISEDGVEADDVIASLVNRACVATRRAAAAAEAAVHAAAGGAELTVDAAAALGTRTSARSGIVRSGGTALAVSASVPGQTSQCAGDVSFFLETGPSRKGAATSAERDTSSSASFSVGGRLCENGGALLCAPEVQPPNGRKNVTSQREGRCLVETDAPADEIFDEIVVVTTDKDLLQVLQYNYMEDVQDPDACARRYGWEAYSFEESGTALSWKKCTRNLAVSLVADTARQCGSVGALRRQTAANALPTGEATPAGNAAFADATSSTLLRGADAAFQTKEDKRLNVSDVEGNAVGERCRARGKRPPWASRKVSTLYEEGGDVRTGEQSYGVVNNIPHGCLRGEVPAESTTVEQEHRSNSSQRPHQGMLKEQAQLKKERYETERSGKQEISPDVAAASPALSVQRVKGPYVRIMQLHRKLRMVDENWVLLHYGVLPHQLRDYLALVGDASDSIRGCEGIGAVTARKLIVHANGRLKDLLNDEQRLSRLVKRNQLRSLLKFAPLLERNRQLISLDSNVESVQAFPFSQFVVRSTRSMAASRRVTTVAGSRRGKKKENSWCA